MACDSIQKMRADMGGTNILSPLKWVIRQPVLRGCPRLLFLITDGAVNNTGKVLELVRNHAFSTRWAQAEGLGLGFSGLPWAGDARPGVTWKMPEGKARTHIPPVLCFQGGVQFSSVQLLSRVQLFVTPWTAAGQATLSITISQTLFKLMSTESVLPSNHLILCHPLFLLPSIFLSIRVFSNESVLRIR